MLEEWGGWGGEAQCLGREGSSLTQWASSLSHVRRLCESDPFLTIQREEVPQRERVRSSSSSFFIREGAEFLPT